MTAPSSSITIDVNTHQPYTVHVGTFLLERAGEIVRSVCKGSRAVIVTDSHVGPLYTAPVTQSLESAGFSVWTFTFPAGEEQKRIDTFTGILEFCAMHELDRSDVIVALGGGVTGDMAGFAAATYMRGCSYVQIPTSLLAMVDSSVGGKTAIDLAAGKNLAGAFWQPRAVIADIGCLATLAPEQFADGCGEVIKHAAIADEDLFCELERTPLTLQLLLDDVTRVAWLIARNIDIKRAVVEADEREGGMRKLLNFGHSIGHAIEVCEEYRLGHGSCVSIGMVAIARATAQAGACPDEVPNRIACLAKEHGLPTSSHVKAEQVYAAALHDKKRHGDAIDLVLPHAIGKCSIDTVDLETFRSLIHMGLKHS